MQREEQSGRTVRGVARLRQFQEMIEKDIDVAERDALCEREGFRTNRYYE